jgi:hypothetical protein
MTAAATDWTNATSEQREYWLKTCRQIGHEFYYIEGSTYRWDCARCNWSEVRMGPTLPLNPSMTRPRFQIIDTWQESR